MYYMYYYMYDIYHTYIYVILGYDIMYVKQYLICNMCIYRYISIMDYIIYSIYIYVSLLFLYIYVYVDAQGLVQIYIYRDYMLNCMGS